MAFFYTYLDTAWGCMLALADSNQLCGLYFIDQKNKPRITQHLLAAQSEASQPPKHASSAPNWTYDPANAAFALVGIYLSRYALNQHTISENIMPHIQYKFSTGTSFAHRVWHAIASVPTGTTISYRELAHKIGAGSNYARAVAAATGRNPLSIIIPCHRIIGLDGSLTGYAGGLERKRALLEHEKLNHKQLIVLPPIIQSHLA